MVIITDSQSTLRRIEAGSLRAEWLAAIGSTAIMGIVWIFCPGHAGVKGNEKADQLAGNANIDENLKMDKAEVMKKLSEHLRHQEIEEEEAHYAIERMREMGVKRGEGRKTQLAGRCRKVRNQVLTGTISQDTLRLVVQGGAEHLWVCPACHEAVSNDK